MADPPGAPAPAGRRSVGLRRSEALWGWVWISPWVIGFLVFTVGPMLVSLYLSMTSFDLISPPTWIGLQNYRTAFTGKDRLFWPSLGRTALFVTVVVPFGVAGSLAMALLVNQRFRGIAFFRTLFYLPSLTPAVAAALVWAWIMQPRYGVLNFFLGVFGIPGPPWMASPTWALPALVVVALWTSLGGPRMMIFLAALQDVPEELTEAATIDGASTWQRFWHVTIPVISPVVFFNFVLGVIATFSVFTFAYVATNGGPAYATWFYVLHLYYNAFDWLQMGYASALSWILFAILSVFTYLQFRTARRWVHYAGETRPRTDA